MFRKFCFRKQAAGGFRRRGPTRRAFARCVRCRCTGFFSAVGRACLARHGAALIVGLAAPRRPRRQPRRLQLLVLGLRLPAASCLVGVALQPHIVAAWRRPPRGAPAGPRCPGRMRSGRPFKVADACCGLVHAQRPSGEYGLRGVARAFFLVVGSGNWRSGAVTGRRGYPPRLRNGSPRRQVVTLWYPPQTIENESRFPGKAAGRGVTAQVSLRSPFAIPLPVRSPLPSPPLV